MSVSRTGETKGDLGLALLQAHDDAGVGHALIENGRVVATNVALSHLCGIEIAELLRASLVDLVGLFGRSRLLGAVVKGAAIRKSGHEETLVRRPDGRCVPVELFVEPLHGRRQSVVLLARDISERKRAEALRQRLVASRAAQEAAESANRCLAFLARASAILQTTADTDTALDHVARLAVPAIADWVVVEQTDPRSAEGLRLVTSVHSDPTRGQDARELRARRGPWARGRALADRAMDERRAISVSSTEEALRNPGQHDLREIELLAGFGARAVLVAPLQAGDRALGAVTLLRLDPRPFAASDAEMAEDLGRRIGIAIEHQRMLATVRESERARERFVLAASHELRTPICALVLRLGLAKSELAEHPEAARAVGAGIDSALKQAERLGRLVDQMLDSTKVATGELEVRPSRRELMTIVRRVAGRLRPWAVRQGCTIDVSGPDQVYGTWDEQRIDQIVDSLLSNAIKFGAGAAVQLTVQAREDEVVLQAIDEGMGIADEDLERVFDAYGSGAPPQDASGLRLGLYLARELVEAHGGTIEVLSTRGCGSTFTVRLPYTPLDRQSAVRLADLLEEREVQQATDRAEDELQVDDEDAASFGGE